LCKNVFTNEEKRNCNVKAEEKQKQNNKCHFRRNAILMYV
jgi:hypothetical protein